MLSSLAIAGFFSCLAVITGMTTYIIGLFVWSFLKRRFTQCRRFHF